MGFWPGLWRLRQSLVSFLTGAGADGTPARGTPSASGAGGPGSAEVRPIPKAQVWSGVSAGLSPGHLWQGQKQFPHPYRVEKPDNRGNGHRYQRGNSKAEGGVKDVGDENLRSAGTGSAASVAAGSGRLRDGAGGSGRMDDRQREPPGRRRGDAALPRSSSGGMP